MTRHPDWQSLLFVLAGQERLLASALRLRPDAVILDLEDAIPPEARPAARAALSASQRHLRDAGIGCAVRVNGSLGDMVADAAALELGSVDALVVPKCDDPRPLENMAELTGGSVPLIALIESPAGLRRIHRIAAVPQLAGLMLGSEDFSASLGIDPDGGLLHPATILALAAAERGLMAVGFPGSIANFRDLGLYARQIAKGRALGMTAVAAIHPFQLPVIAAAFAPPPCRDPVGAEDPRPRRTDAGRRSGGCSRSRPDDRRPCDRPRAAPSCAPHPTAAQPRALKENPMPRPLITAAAQMGPIARSDTRVQTVHRLVEMMREARSRGAGLVVFTELALTTFFPRWLITDEEELDSYYETTMPSPATQPLFDEARRLGIGFSLGYAELVIENGVKRRFNTAILVDRTGRIIGKYRKVHLPGHDTPQPGRAFQDLEKRYFEPGNLGFPVFRGFGGVMGMAICNDRRWPETYRLMGLQAVDMVMLGYNAPFDHTGDEAVNSLTLFHNHLSMQAGAYKNATWGVGTAKCGTEEGSRMGAQSVIIAPSGEIVAQATNVEDEVITAKCDLDMGRIYKETIFNFARHRRPEHYGLIVGRAGAIPPAGGDEP